MPMNLHSCLRLVSCRFAKPARPLPNSRFPFLTRFHVVICTAQTFCWVRRSPPLALAVPRSPQRQLLKTIDLLSADHDDQGVAKKLIIPSKDNAGDLCEPHEASEMQKKVKDSSEESGCSNSSALCFDATLNREYEDPSSLFAPSVNDSSPGDPVRNDSHFNNDGDRSKDNQGENCEGSKKTFQVKRVINVNHAVRRNVGDQNVRWFPYLDQFKIKGYTLSSSEIMQMLAPFLSEERRERIERAATNRTYSVCPVVEGLVDLGNISAVFRSAEALGFQSVHVISNETTKRYKRNRKVSMGTEKWLDAELWGTTKECLETLRSRGYRIAVAHVADDTVSIFNIDWTVPTAVVFGNENQGVSIDALQMSDIRCSIPMGGMVDSFNVSVAAGIVMHHAVHDRIARWGKHGDLSPEEQKILSADFYLRHNSKTLTMIDRLLEKNQAGKQTALTSVLRGELEVGIEIPEYLKIKHENISQEKDTQ